MRIRHVEELASELVISQNQYWGRHRSEVEDEPVASLEDLEWADGVAFRHSDAVRQRGGTAEAVHGPAGGLWQEESSSTRWRPPFTASMTTHGAGVDDPRPQQHPLPLGHAHPPARLHGERGVQRRRQPVWHLVHEREAGRGSRRESARGCPLPGSASRPLCRSDAPPREADAFRVKRPRPERFQAAALD